MKSHPYLFLAAIFALLFLAGNELAAVTDTAESNYALTAREMVLSGDWMSPRIYGHYWYDKPIFFYWELALSFADFGFNEFAARLPSAVFGVASVLYTFWFSSKVYDRKTGWTAALILGTSLEFWLLSKAVVTDAALFFFMSVSIASFYLGYREDRKYYFLCYAAAALAVLTKGPIGLALAGAFSNPVPFMEAGSEGNAPRPSDFRHGVISSSLRAVVHIHDRLSRHRFPFEFLRCP